MRLSQGGFVPMSDTKPKIWERGGPSPNPKGRPVATLTTDSTSPVLDNAAKAALRLLVKRTRDGDVQSAALLLDYARKHRFQ